MVDLSGLGSFAGLNDDVAPDSNLQEIEIDRIDESPNIGRPHYDQKKLEELAEAIKERGVKSPISVHPHPSEEGRFIVNYGHRRLRASKIAGKTTIWAIVDEDFDELDQAVENIQREDLEAVGVATIIQHALKQGKTKSQIAQRLGKPKSFVSDHAMFFELADDIRALYDEGLCTSMRILAMFQRAFNKWPVEVTEYCREGSEFTAAAVNRLTDHLKQQDKKAEDGSKQEREPQPGENERGVGGHHESLEPQPGEGEDGVGGHHEPLDPQPGEDEDGVGGHHESLEPQSGEDEGGVGNDQAPVEMQTGEGNDAGTPTGPGSEDDQPSLFGEGVIEDPRIAVTVHGLQDSTSGGRAGELVMRPSEPGKLWVQFEDDGTMELVKAKMVVIEHIVERY
ncbi:ParB/RepB/Spo0J family partition protein [Halomonas elongata]|uniref:ParB/RepB/Spo0J family partition protein n=1 Tax=Halomonas elongata TaxID=2746 RepID=UPI00255B1F13|nr:ParB/RepB/Spo0J family partition protein [Halomonas elongata]MDL4860778.1 ParB/RepB/Spo0J family partition protein [Halomonas elongata]